MVEWSPMNLLEYAPEIANRNGKFESLWQNWRTLAKDFKVNNTKWSGLTSNCGTKYHTHHGFAAFSWMTQSCRKLAAFTKPSSVLIWTACKINSSVTRSSSCLRNQFLRCRPSRHPHWTITTSLMCELWLLLKKSNCERVNIWLTQLKHYFLLAPNPSNRHTAPP